MQPESTPQLRTEVSSISSAATNGQNSAVAPSVKDFLIRRINQLQPWRMNIQITDSVSTGDYLNLHGTNPTDCRNVRNKARGKFLELIDSLYPTGLANKRFLDCGCNAGGYCFWVRERKAEIGLGFDVQEHWIKQARFVKNQRTVFPKDRIRFEVWNLFDLPAQDLNAFDIVNFKGLFYHLADPINGLKIAADLSRDILIFSTAFVWGEPDGSLKSELSEKQILHGGTEKLNWFPTGPGICAEIIRHLGFHDLRLTKLKQVKSRPDRGRLEIIAAREPNRLINLRGKSL